MTTPQTTADTPTTTATDTRCTSVYPHDATIQCAVDPAPHPDRLHSAQPGGRDTAYYEWEDAPST